MRLGNKVWKRASTPHRWNGRSVSHTRSVAVQVPSVVVSVGDVERRSERPCALLVHQDGDVLGTNFGPCAVDQIASVRQRRKPAHEPKLTLRQLKLTLRLPTAFSPEECGVTSWKLPLEHQMRRCAATTLWCVMLLSMTVATASAMAAEVKTHAAYQVFCTKPALCDRLRSGLQKRFVKAGVEMASTDAPRVMLVLYVIKDVNSRKNPDGLTIAIAYTSNIPLWNIASAVAGPKGKRRLPKPLAGALHGGSGILWHLSAASIDEPSATEIDAFLDQIVHAFLAKFPFLQKDSKPTAQ